MTITHNQPSGTEGRPEPVCPECGRDGASAKAESRRVRGPLRWLGLALVLGLIGLQVGRAAWQLTSGWQTMTIPGQPYGFGGFVGTQRGWTHADVARLAAGLDRGDELTRAILLEPRPWSGPSSADAIEVCWDTPRGRQLLIELRGWPVHWHNRNLDRTVDHVFTGLDSLGSAVPAATPWTWPEPADWRVATAHRQVGDTWDRLLILRSPLAALLAVGALVFLVARRASRRLGQSPARAAALAAALAILTMSGLLIPGLRNTESRISIMPVDAVTRPFLPTGLTVGDLRGMVGSEDADERVARAIVAAAPPAAETDVLMARRAFAAPLRLHLAEIGWPMRMVFFARATRPNPNGSGLLPLDPGPTHWLIQTGELTWSSRVKPGQLTATSLGFELGEIGVWVLRLIALWWAAHGLSILVARWRSSRRARHGLCRACGYDLRGIGRPEAGAAP
jgi:hypothetical protein